VGKHRYLRLLKEYQAPPPTRDDLKDAFDAIDLDGSGSLSAKEFRSVFFEVFVFERWRCENEVTFPIYGSGSLSSNESRKVFLFCFGRAI
jgi:hypothetical protein